MKPSDRSRPSLLLAALLPRARAGRLRKSDEEEGRGNRQEHVRLPIQRRALRRRASPTARRACCCRKAQRVTLYQVPTGFRRALQQRHAWNCAARAAELQLIRDGVVTPLKDCEPYAICRPPSSRRGMPAHASGTAGVGVIGTGAMGMGVVESLLRAGFATHARDILPEVQARGRRTRRDVPSGRGGAGARLRHRDHPRRRCRADRRRAVRRGRRRRRIPARRHRHAVVDGRAGLRERARAAAGARTA